MSLIKNIAHRFKPWFLRNALAKRGNHPGHIIFLMKNHCNANCIMCGLQYRDSAKRGEITLEDAKRIFGNLNMNRIRTITFSGGGDPLLARDLIRIIAYTRKEYPGVALAMFTNGIALSNEYAERIAEAEFSEVVISINASTSPVHKTITGVDCFERVVENTRNLVRIRNASGAKTRVRLSFVALRQNIDDLPNLIALASELGVDEVSAQYCRFYSHRFVPGTADGNRKVNDEDSLFYHKEYSDKIFSATIEEAKALKVKFTCEPLFGEAGGRRKCRSDCLYPWTTILVGPEGEVYPCGGGEVMFYKAVLTGRRYFGNLLKEKISDFWNNRDYQSLRRSCVRKNLGGETGQCGNCNHTIVFKGPNDRNSHFINIDVE